MIIKNYFVRILRIIKWRKTIINGKIQKLIDNLDVDEKEGVDRLKEKYNPNTNRNRRKFKICTSCALNKGEKIVSAYVKGESNEFMKTMQL